MNSAKRPIAVLFLSCLYIAIGTVGFVVNIPKLIALGDIWSIRRSPSQQEIIGRRLRALFSLAPNRGMRMSQMRVNSILKPSLRKGKAPYETDCRPLCRKACADRSPP